MPTMPNVLRIIDANANRARESLRVMEEAARFVLNSSPLCSDLKGLRHDLATALQPIKGLEFCRDTPSDVGTAISTESEYHRDGVAAVAIAAGKRLSEALRAIEEYSKTLGEQGRGLSPTIEALRYRAYDIDQRLNYAAATGIARQWRLCVVLTETLCNFCSWQQVLSAAVDAGVDCIQVRETSMDATSLLHHAEEVVAICRGRNVTVIINDRPDIALLSGADGVHLGQQDLPCAQARKLVGRQLLIGVSTSQLSEAKQAVADGADYCGVGPMFTTTTKQKDVIVGPDYLCEYIAWDRLPHLAIGGIQPANIGQLIDAGVSGVAVSSAVCGAADPGEVVDQLLAVLPETTMK